MNTVEHVTDLSIVLASNQELIVLLEEGLESIEEDLRDGEARPGDTRRILRNVNLLLREIADQAEMAAAQAEMAIESGETEMAVKLFKQAQRAALIGQQAANLHSAIL